VGAHSDPDHTVNGLLGTEIHGLQHACQQRWYQGTKILFTLFSAFPLLNMCSGCCISLFLFSFFFPVLELYFGFYKYVLTFQYPYLIHSKGSLLTMLETNCFWAEFKLLLLQYGPVGKTDIRITKPVYMVRGFHISIAELFHSSSVSAPSIYL